MSSNDGGTIIIIKLGGAAITDKNKHRCVLTDIVTNCARRISECIARNNNKKAFAGIILVHGAGSYAHHESKQFDLATSAEKNKNLSAEQILALTSARQGLHQLNHVVVGSLLEQKVPATYLSSFRPPAGDALLSSSAAATTSTTTRLVAEEALSLCLGSGGIIVPVLHGDFVLSSSSDSSCSANFQSAVLSGDDILLHLATAATRRGLTPIAVFVSDVSGVFTADPNVDPSAKLLRQVFVSSSTSCGDVSKIVLEGGGGGGDENVAMPNLQTSDDKQNCCGDTKKTVTAAAQTTSSAAPPDVTRAMQGKWESAVGIVSLPPQDKKDQQQNSSNAARCAFIVGVKQFSSTSLLENIVDLCCSKHHEDDKFLMMRDDAYFGTMFVSV